MDPNTDSAASAAGAGAAGTAPVAGTAAEKKYITELTDKSGNKKYYRNTVASYNSLNPENNVTIYDKPEYSFFGDPSVNKKKSELSEYTPSSSATVEFKTGWFGGKRRKSKKSKGSKRSTSSKKSKSSKNSKSKKSRK